MQFWTQLEEGTKRIQRVLQRPIVIAGYATSFLDCRNPVRQVYPLQCIFLDFENRALGFESRLETQGVGQSVGRREWRFPLHRRRF